MVQCPIPILTGIGHQTDTSLVDLIADKSLETPTACAIFLTQGFKAIFQTIEKTLLNISQQLIQHYEQAIQRIITQNLLNKKEIEKIITSYHHQIQSLCNKITALNPLAKLEQGYSVTSCNNSIVQSVNNVSKDAMITTTVRNGVIKSIVRDVKYAKKTIH